MHKNNMRKYNWATDQNHTKNKNIRESECTGLNIR